MQNFGTPPYQRENGVSSTQYPIDNPPYSPPPHIHPRPQHHHLPPSAEKKPSLRTDTFLPELLAALLSLVCLAATALLLWRYDGRPLSEWQLGITLNALVSVLATVAKSALAMAVSAGLSQGKWVWFSGGRRGLRDIETFDGASRGPVGGVELLWLMKGRHLVSLGAFVMIMSVAVGPFIQQVISIRGFDVPFAGIAGDATVPYSERYDMGSEFLQEISIVDKGGNSFGTTFTHLDFSMTSAIYKGLTASQASLLQEIPFTCSTGNCTWPVFPSLAVCSQCHDVTSLLSRTSEVAAPFALIKSGQNLAVMTTNVTTYSLPNGVQINNADGLLEAGGVSTFMTAGYTRQPSQTMNFKENEMMLFSISTIRAGDEYEGNRTDWVDASVKAAECALYYCINAYDASATKGTLSEEIVASWSIKDPSSWQPLPLSDQPSGTEITHGSLDDLANPDGLAGDPTQGYLNRTDLELSPPPQDDQEKYNFPPSTKYSIAQPSIDSISNFLTTLFTNDANNTDIGFTGIAIRDLAKNTFEYSPDVMQILYDSTLNRTDPTPVTLLANLARSLTNSIRTNPQTGALSAGTVARTVPQFHVRWAWMVFPAAVVVLGCVFLVGAMWESWRAGVGVWKGSVLAVLWHGFDGEVRGVVGEAGGVGEMRKRAEGVEFALWVVVAAGIQPRETTAIPDYVNTYAPLVYLDQNELYLPSDIQAQLNNTYAALNFTAIKNAPSPLLLSNVDQLNAIGNCDVDNFDACPVYLTSKDNVTTDPPWLYGVLPDPTTHETVGARSCAIIVYDHGDGMVDAFYMYFYAFNLGNTVLGQTLGNHVGDWEHTMLRFKDGKPVSMWYSQHDSGQAFTYESLSKNGTRPIVYSALGTHASYTVPGTHSRSIATLLINDTTSAGPLWDPILSAYYYTFAKTPSFTPSDPSTPTSWLSFLGRWGDERYPDSDPRQTNFLNLSVAWKYETGPTGPLDKSLVREDVCPEGSKECVTSSVLPGVSGSSVPATVSRSVSATATSKGGGVSSTAKAAAGSVRSADVRLGVAGMAVAAAVML
ncbi:hypothetical protein FGG08_000432 [Glutinoglossum americanum]|uniref:Uncharacterized protein n=1 Tax=Glutinoglossum americanum TaxID=1670608 RepID=A0A9P8I3S1_9PEZI|nr:hypothetical protein FGG08_000432 [Glutinoglossum americanum]